MGGIFYHLATIDSISDDRMRFKMTQNIVRRFFLRPQIGYAQHQPNRKGILVGVQKAAPFDAIGRPAHKLIAHARSSAQLKPIFQALLIKADNLLNTREHMIGRHIVGLQSHLPRQQIIHTLGNNDHLRVKLLIPGFNPYRATTLHEDLIHLNIGGNKGLLGIVTRVNGLLHFPRQPIIKTRPKHHDARVGRLVPMTRLKIQGKGRLLIHQTKPAMIHKTLPAAVLLLPILRHQLRQIAPP